MTKEEFRKELLNDLIKTVVWWLKLYKEKYNKDIQQRLAVLNIIEQIDKIREQFDDTRFKKIVKSLEEDEELKKLFKKKEEQK